MIKPLNVWSRSDEDIGRQLSNFAHTPFELDGIVYASVEGFYVSLLLPPGGSRQEKSRRLWGVRAKRETPRITVPLIDYHGQRLGVGSPEHIALIRRAIAAKFAAHPEIARSFVATHPRPIVHETGYPDPPGAALPKEVFCLILHDLREDLARQIR